MQYYYTSSWLKILCSNYCQLTDNLDVYLDVNQFEALLGTKKKEPLYLKALSWVIPFVISAFIYFNFHQLAIQYGNKTVLYSFDTKLTPLKISLNQVRVDLSYNPKDPVMNFENPQPETAKPVNNGSVNLGIIDKPQAGNIEPEVCNSLTQPVVIEAFKKGAKGMGVPWAMLAGLWNLETDGHCSMPTMPSSVEEFYSMKYIGDISVAGARGPYQIMPGTGGPVLTTFSVEIQNCLNSIGYQGATDFNSIVDNYGAAMCMQGGVLKLKESESGVDLNNYYEVAHRYLGMNAPCYPYETYAGFAQQAKSMNDISGGWISGREVSRQNGMGNDRYYCAAAAYGAKLLDNTFGKN